MRPIDLIVVHCTATRCVVDVGVAEVTEWHKARGFDTIGYHYLIRLDGTVENGRELSRVGAHAQGHNATSVGICLVGGLDQRGKPSNTFSREQFAALQQLIDEIRMAFPRTRIVGHRDLSPDQNGDGRITPNEYLKDCPCFDVRGWCAQRGIFPDP